MAINSLNTDWKLFLVRSSDMGRIGEIKQARSRSFTFAKNKSGGCDFTIPGNYELFADAKEIKYGIVAYRNGVPKYSGMIWKIGENVSGNRIQVSSVGWFETLNHRICRQQVGYPPFGTGSITGGEMIFAPASGTPGQPNYFPGGLLTIANAQQDTWIKQGVSLDKIKRILAYEKGQKIGDAVTQLSEVEGGFDFDISVLEREMNIYNWDEVKDRTSEAVFGFNWGPRNIKELSREFDPTVMVNRMTAMGKFGGGFAEDVESQQEYQLFEEEVQLNDVVDTNVLLGYAGEEVLLRKQPRVLYSFTPFPYTSGGRVPEPFVDYDLGDMVMFSAIRKPRVDIRKQAMRIFGMNVAVSDEGNETITSLQVSP